MTDTTIDTTAEQAAPPPFTFRGWARVELMGRRVRYGFVETRLWGTAGVMTITLPKPGGDEVEIYGAAAIFSMAPDTEESCRDWHRRFSYRPTAAPLSVLGDHVSEPAETASWDAAADDLTSVPC